MRPFLLCLFYWLGTLWGFTYFFPILFKIHPNLVFIVPLLLTFRWKGSESYFISAFFGLTADAFAGTPFGLNGLIFFFISFLARWTSLKFIQSNFLAIFFQSLVFLLIHFFLKNTILILLDFDITMTAAFRNTFFYQILPTAIIAAPIYFGMKMLDEKADVKLAERKF